MLCQRCKKNPATIKSFVESLNGEKYEGYLCAFCYNELFGELNSKANADIWAGLFGDSAPSVKVCPVCKTKYSDYERTGLLGCASCYDVFKDELIPSIRRIQGKVRHVGKREQNTDDLGLYIQLKSLQQQLENAIRERRFEDANRINSRINAITKQLNGGE